MKKLLGLIALTTILMAGIAWAAITCTFDQTATTVGTGSTYLYGTQQNMSVTITGWTLSANSSAAKISVSGGTIAGTQVNNQSGLGNQTYFNTTVDTTSLLDTTTYTFTMEIFNESNGVSLTTCTRNFITDNTAPACKYASTLTSNSKYKPDQEWKVTCSNASSATIKFGSKGAFNMIESADVCTYTGNEQSLPESVYHPLITVTNDGLNTTSCNLNYIRIDQGAPLKEVAVIAAVTGAGKAGEAQTSNNNLALLVVFALAAFGYIKYVRKK